MSRQLCKSHPDVDYKTAWGCPECVRELREALCAMVQYRLGPRFSPQGKDNWQIWADRYRDYPNVDKPLLAAVDALCGCGKTKGGPQ